MSKKVSYEKRNIVYNKYNNRCAYCGERLYYSEMQVDHILPQYRGGNHDIENLNPSCASCNSSKATFTISDWKEQLSLKADRLIRDSCSFRLLLKFGLIKITKKKVKFYFENYE